MVGTLLFNRVLVCMLISKRVGFVSNRAGNLCRLSPRPQIAVERALPEILYELVSCACPGDRASRNLCKLP